MKEPVKALFYLEGGQNGYSEIRQRFEMGR